jgi:predicted SAM-dependent methyltransferase
VSNLAKSLKDKLYRIPAVGYLFHLVEAFFRLPRNDTRIRDLRARTSDLEAWVHGKTAGRSSHSASDGRAVAGQHLPALLNAIETVPALSHELARNRRELDTVRTEIAAMRQVLMSAADKDIPNELSRLWQRLEFVRMEMMYEMNYGLRSSLAPEKATSVERKILNTEKVAAQMREFGGVRLNLGCGHIPLDGYLNTDMRALPGVDVVADVSDLPFDAGQAQEIFSAHLLEHFPQERLVRALLPYWFRLLTDGGEFRAISPDGAAMIDASASGTYSYEDFRTVLFGAQEYDGDFHFNLLTPQSLGALLEDAGFNEVRIIEAGRRNGRCFEFEISARKPISA